MIRLITVVLALGGLAYSQGTAERPAPSYDELKAYLSLTDAQLAALTAAREAALESAKPLMEQIREKHQALRSTTDEAAIAKIMAEINALQEKVKAIMDEARAAALGTLTAAQQAKVKTLEEALALQGEIRQAGSLGLLSAPEGSTPGPGGPGMRGFGGMRR